MADDEDSLFKAEMAGVKPLKKPSPATPGRFRDKPTPGQLYRREAAQRSLEGSNFLPAQFIEQVHPQAELSFKRQGIQNGVFRSLQQGAYPIEATLDLHLMSIEEARDEVYAFIQECVRFEVRTALINHGKGAAIIKSCVARWLPMFPEVMAFHSAQRFHGGTGAVYVLIRKSAREKEKTLERLGLKSSKPQS
jgi:DNA-nicking Smr family endonuclease